MKNVNSAKICLAERYLKSGRLINTINICPSCKGIVPDGMKFCSKCGTDIQSLKEENLPEPLRTVERDGDNSKNEEEDNIIAPVDATKGIHSATPINSSMNEFGSPVNVTKHSRHPFKGVGVFSLILGIAFIIFGLILPIPKKDIDLYTFSFSHNEWTGDKFEEYVGGDAYNIMIEASLRGGIIAGRTATKAILVVGGSAFIVTGLILFKIKERQK